VGGKATALHHAFAMHSDSPVGSIPYRFKGPQQLVPRHTCAMQDTRQMEASNSISAGEAVLDGFG